MVGYEGPMSQGSLFQKACGMMGVLCIADVGMGWIYWGVMGMSTGGLPMCE